MNLHDLSAHAQAGRIEELNLISLEGGIYLLCSKRGWKGVPTRFLPNRAVR